MSPLIYFDTSIFIEMAAKRSKYRKHIRELLKELTEAKAKVYTSIITVQEVSVADYRPGSIARDAYGDVKAVAKVYGISKQVALTCAKHEASLKHAAEMEDAKRDKTKPEPLDKQIERVCENRRRKWDCFHVATAQAVGCTEFYTTDEKLLKRPSQLDIKTLTTLKPGESVRRITGPIADHSGYIEVK